MKIWKVEKKICNHVSAPFTLPNFKGENIACCALNINHPPPHAVAFGKKSKPGDWTFGTCWCEQVKLGKLPNDEKFKKGGCGVFS